MSWEPIATALIQRWESYRGRAYLCPAGVWTIGWGSTGRGIRQGTVWTLDEANARFREDLQHFGLAVSKLVKTELADHEFAALVSLAYNIGTANFQDSTLRRLLNSGDKAGAANEFRRWVFASVKGRRVKLRGLVARREDEARVFRGVA